ncbi:MAG TPA: ABC transporter substrate-binding protein [Kofleriaceae bacterium]|nr:ABC transporter substrate-binding protein [Kofleriaceae bacterium]
MLILAASAHAHAEGRPAFGGGAIGSLLGEPASLDPVAARTHAEIEVVGLVFDTLYQVRADGAVTPHLAAGAPQVSPDGLHATIAIRPGVVFHDGSALTPKDVAASLDRLAKSDAGWLLAPVARIDADPTSITITLAAPTPELALYLAQPQSAITPNGAAQKKNPIGSGPFRVTSLDRKRQRLALVAFDQHFAGRPYLDELELRWYTSGDEEARRYEIGDTQLSLRGQAVFAGHQPKYATDELESPATVLVYVGFGRAHAAALASADFRNALSLALARSGFTAVGTGERVEPAVDPVPVELGGTAVDGVARTGDLDAAKAALARAAKSVPSVSGLKLEVTVDMSRPDDREIAERVVRALDKLGITATIASVDAPQLAERISKGTLDLYIGQLPLVTAAPGLAWASAFEAGGDAWARRALAGGSIDPAQAKAQFAKALPIVPLYFRALRVYHRSDLRGLGFDGIARLGFADLFAFGAPRRHP